MTAEKASFHNLVTDRLPLSAIKILPIDRTLVWLTERIVHPREPLRCSRELLGVGLVDYRVRNPKMSLAAFYLYYFLEQISYGSGVFWGCLRMKSFASYRLDLKGT